MSKKNETVLSWKPRGDEPPLDARYGEIGISAVAAALRYGSDARNPAYAPSVPQPQDWFADTAA